MPLDSVMQMFAESLVVDLQENLRKKLQAKSDNGYTGDSRLGASIRIEYTYSVNGEGTAFKITGFNLYLSDYYYWVNKGRASGKGVSREGQEKMALWVKSRGLTPTLGSRTNKKIKAIKHKKIKKAVKQISYNNKVKQIVFVISKKIKEKGYEANHFLYEVLADGRLDRFSTYLKEQYAQDLKLELLNVA